MPNFLVTLSNDEAAALALELVTDQDPRTPEQWLKDKVTWALDGVLTRYRVARAEIVLAALADADPAATVKTLQATIDAASAVALPAPVTKPPVVGP